MAIIRKLIKLSRSSLVVNIPTTILKKYGWKEHQKLTIKDAGRGKLEIRDWKRRGR